MRHSGMRWSGVWGLGLVLMAGCGSGSETRDDGGVACGQEGQACCAMAQCEDGLQCLEGICQHGRVGDLGKECDNNFDCEGRLCLPVVFCDGCSTGDDACTAECSSNSDCLPGWECLALSGLTGKVCQCARTGSEECDGADNDCDGIVDNLPEADEACDAEHANYMCRSGTCKCGGAVCGGQCVDTSSDLQHCGGCGQACTPPAHGIPSCTVGVCGFTCEYGYVKVGDTCTDRGQDAAAQVDVNQQDVMVQVDTARDTAVQTDAVQADAANTSGNVVIVQASPQLTGTGMDPSIGWIKASYVLAGWDAVENDPDVPTTVLDLRSGPFGCYAKYYKKGQVKDGGAVSDYLPTTANAGDVTVTGYTPGAFFVINPLTGGPQITDAGTPLTEAFPTTINCKRTVIEEQNDAGVIPDAGTGRYDYTCDNLSSQGQQYVTSFMAPTDSLHVQATGTTEIGAFDATAVGVAPFIKVLPLGTLWQLPTVAAAYGTDAGVPIGYACGDTDAGVNTAPCAAALAIQITWGDVDTAMTSIEASPPWRQERGKIQCAKVGARNQFFVPWEIWNAAFPTGANWRTITTFITHITVVSEHSTTVVGAGGGQIGVTHVP